MAIYLCAVLPRFPENYQIGIHAGTWGVEEKYKNRIASVVPGDTLVFLVAGQYRSIHRIESVPFVDQTPLWPAKDGDYFPYRVKISEPLFLGAASAVALANQISFMKGKTWGGTIQGASGVFNDRLTTQDLALIKSHMSGAPTPIKQPEPIEIQKTSERQLALFKFYESDIEEKVANSLDALGLKLYVEPGTGRTGKQFVIEGGRIDLLCEDATTGDLVVVELKKGQAPEQTLLQILKYMQLDPTEDGWQKRREGNNSYGVCRLNSPSCCYRSAQCFDSILPSKRRHTSRGGAALFSGITESGCAGAIVTIDICDSMDLLATLALSSLPRAFYLASMSFEDRCTLSCFWSTRRDTRR